MAVDLSAQAPPRQVKRAALAAVADNLTLVILPEWARLVTVAFMQADELTTDTGYLTFAGVDGASKGSDWLPIPAGAAYVFEVNPAPDDNSVVYLAAATNSAFAHLSFER